jgi:hypothetical protein
MSAEMTTMLPALALASVSFVMLALSLQRDLVLLAT